MFLSYLKGLADQPKNIKVEKVIHPKTKTVSSFTQSQAVPNLYDVFFSFVEHKRRYFEECW